VRENWSSDFQTVYQARIRKKHKYYNESSGYGLKKAKGIGNRMEEGRKALHEGPLLAGKGAMPMARR